MFVPHKTLFSLHQINQASSKSKLREMIDSAMVSNVLHQKRDLAEELHAPIAKSSKPTMRKRKARDTGAVDQQADPKRRRRDAESSKTTAIEVLNGDEGLTKTVSPPSLNLTAGSSVQHSSHLTSEELDRSEPAENSIDERKESSHAVRKLSSSTDELDDSLRADGSSMMSRRIHKKFGSKATESMPALTADEHAFNVQADDVLIDEHASNSTYDSEDEAPETVSAAAGFLHSRQAVADAAKAEET